MNLVLAKEAKRIEDYAIKLHTLLDTRNIPRNKLIHRIKFFLDYHDAAILDVKARLEQSISQNQQLLCEIRQLKGSLDLKRNQHRQLLCEIERLKTSTKRKPRKVAKEKLTRIPRQDV